MDPTKRTETGARFASTREEIMKFNRIGMAAAASAVWLAMSGPASFAADPYEGVWKVQDSSGKPMEITLSSGGKASANGHRMSGTWKEEGNAAVISWSTGWTTKIEKQDGGYKHSAYRKGQPPTGTPNNSSDAEKVK
jgi:hypothetical protein